MVARFRTSLQPIHRIKHVVDYQQALPKGTQLSVDIAAASDAPTLAAVTTCETGSKINAFYCNIQCVASDTSTTATANIYLLWARNVGTNLAFPDGNSVGSDDNKRFIIHQEMNMFNPTDGGNPRVLFNGVIVIPKGMRRMGPNDKWRLYMFIPTTGVDVNICMQFHYKEFR